MAQSDAAPINDRFSTPFGIPLGGLGWFASLLMGLASGFIALFASTFVAIISLLVYITVTHRSAGSVDFAIAYRDVGVPVGIVVMALGLAYFGTLWVRRKLGRGQQ